MKKMVKKTHSLIIKNIALSVLILFGLTACDNGLYNRLFRNPHIVEVAKVDSINANEWYEFETNANAFNKVNEIYISFKGSEAGNIKVKTVKIETPPLFLKSVITSSAFPGSEINFDVKAVDADDVEYDFSVSGTSAAIVFNYKDEVNLTGKTIQKIRIKSNLDHENVNVEWISVTRK